MTEGEAREWAQRREEGDGGRRWMEVEKPGLGGGRKKGGKLKRFQEKGRSEDQAGCGRTRQFRAAVASSDGVGVSPTEYLQPILSAATRNEILAGAAECSHS